MNRKKILNFLILVLLGCVISLEAKKNPVQYSEHHLIDKILENHRYCVAAFEGNKIFIRPENIISTDQGLFINVNGAEFYQLPLLQFNKNGHFIEGTNIRDIDLKATKKEQTKGSCPNCGVNTDKYGYCRNEECFFCGFKVL